MRRRRRRRGANKNSRACNIQLYNFYPNQSTSMMRNMNWTKTKNYKLKTIYPTALTFIHLCVFSLFCTIQKKQKWMMREQETEGMKEEKKEKRTKCELWTGRINTQTLIHTACSMIYSLVLLQCSSRIHFCFNLSMYVCRHSAPYMIRIVVILLSRFVGFTIRCDCDCIK